MDPVTVLGAGAAAVQLAEFGAKGLIGIIRLAKDLRNVPNRLKILLTDVEKALQRIEALHGALQDPASTMVTQLQASQVEALRVLVADAHSTIECVYQKLRHISEPKVQANLGSVRRAWRAMVSLKLEQELEKKLEKIQRINTDLTRQLQVATIEMQSDQSVRIADITKSTELLREDMKQLRIDGDVAHEETRTLVTKVLIESQVATKTSITELRDAVVTLALGRTDALQPDHVTTAAELSPLGREYLVREVCEALAKHPSALNKCCDNGVSSIYNAARSVDLTSTFHSKPVDCSCRLSRRRRFRKYGFLGLNYEELVPHYPSCPFTKVAEQSSRYTVSVQLIPVLEKTVEFMFGASFQGGGFSLSHSIRAFATVKREYSPLFKLFDDVPSLCARRCYGPLQNGCRDECSSSIYEKKVDRFFHFHWDIESVRIQLRFLPQRLLCLAAEGSAALTDKDECGRTLLHEVMQLIGYLGRSYVQVLSEIRGVLNCLGRVSLDLGAVGSIGSSSLHELDDILLRRYDLEREEYATAQDMAAQFAFRFINRYPLNFPLFEYFEGFDMGNARYEIYDPDYDSDEEGLIPIHEKLRAWKFYKAYPILLEDQGALESAIWRRDLISLRKVLKSGEVDKSRWSTRNLSPLDMSLGWLPGLSALLVAEIPDQVPAIGLALLLDELPAAKVLLSKVIDPSECRILECAVNSSDEAQVLVIEEITRRRLELRALALEWLTSTDQRKLEVHPKKSLDSNAAAVYQRLRSNGIDVPTSLDPQRSLWKIIASEVAGASPCRATAFFEKLVASGFEDFDAPDHLCHQETTLMWYCKRARWNSNQRKLDIILWLLKRGAKCWNRENTWAPSILFYAARLRGSAIYFEHHSSQNCISEITRLAAVVDDPLLTDSCDCACSNHGCLASRAIFAGVEIPYRRFWYYISQLTTRAVLDEDLLEWLNSCHLDRAQREVFLNDAVRLEVFERLGLVHTCCRAKMGSEKQDDDSELEEPNTEMEEHLDLIIEAFGRFQSLSTGPESDLLTQWWRKLDSILPDLEPEARCNYHDRSWNGSEDSTDLQVSRVELEEKALLASGYGGMDFTEVIKLHFREYLSSVK
ncbi:hypothetical protein BGZ63DRAFT_450072 [Mariannaea sp. PMI_226]|nr:hypothetical protein BGZ63DRAFT_450072 [Mariannaea sp. PMI_226]